MTGAPTSGPPAPAPATTAVATNPGGYATELEKKRMHLGQLGKLFGGEDAPTNIVGLNVTLIVLACIVLMFFATDRVEVAKLLIPLATAGIGYLFGRRG